MILSFKSPYADPAPCTLATAALLVASFNFDWVVVISLYASPMALVEMSLISLAPACTPLPTVSTILTTAGLAASLGSSILPKLRYCVKAACTSGPALLNIEFADMKAVF